MDKIRQKRMRQQLKQRAMWKEASAAKQAAGFKVTTSETNEAFRRDIELRMAEIPQDNRTFQQRLFGDPIYERSALYAKRMEPANA